MANEVSKYKKAFCGYCSHSRTTTSPFYKCDFETPAGIIIDNPNNNCKHFNDVSCTIL